MELGGNAPFLVFDDADLDEAVEALLAKMRNIGEVHGGQPLPRGGVGPRGVLSRLAEKMGSLKLGRGTEDDVKVGPLIDEPSREKVKELVDDAVQRGGKLLVGGEPPDGRGYFFPPTVLDDVPIDARVFHEEIFGPVAPDRRLRLRGGGDRARERHRVRPGRLRVHPRHQASDPRLRGPRDRDGRPEPGNGLERRSPFEGVKQSGIGREGGHEGLEEFLETKYVAVNL